MIKKQRLPVFLLMLLGLLLPVWVQGQAFFNQAPMLQAQVEAGTLPPVEERLPSNPMLVVPVETVGSYGGTWHTTLQGERDHFWFIRTLGYENLMRWNPELTQVIPNIAQSVDVSPDVKEYTFHLREGMRWSDGVPFTADDIMFWYEDVFLNTELTPAAQDWLVTDGVPVEVEKVDDFTVVFRFSSPNGLFLQNMATTIGAEPTSYPRHYLEQFHPNYNPDIDKLVESAGVADWVELFKANFGDPGTVDNVARWQHPDVPTLNAWTLTSVYGDGDQVIAQRNPYYWKIDIAGNQLPYIDEIEYTVVPDVDTIVQRVLDGKVDMQDRHLATPENRPVFETNADAVGYRFFSTLNTISNNVAINFNLTDQDPNLREIFQNKDFRIGMSYAINRDQIIEQVYAGHGTPYQVGPRPESPFYNEKLATQFLDYDVDAANAHLDAAGYTERDTEGFRLGPDGERISFNVEVTDVLGLNAPAVMELVIADWAAVGVEATITVEDRSVFIDNAHNNADDVNVWQGDGGIEVLLEPRYYFPFSVDGSKFAVAWAYWRTDPSNPIAEEPSQPAQEQMALYSQLQATSDVSEQNQLMNKILEIAADQFYVIGTVLPGDGYGIVRNDFHNVLGVMPSAGLVYPNPAPTNPCQYFITSAS